MCPQRKTSAIFKQIDGYLSHDVNIYNGFAKQLNKATSPCINYVLLKKQTIVWFITRNDKPSDNAIALAFEFS